VAVLTTLSTLAPAGVKVGAREIADGPMFEVEVAHVRAAVPRRRREFATGRALLRDLIGRDIAIPAGTDRAPVFPPDVCGSLAHDERFAVAAVARRPEFVSIGIDIEPIEPLDEATSRAILRPDEGDADAHLAFTLKEAAYKAWSGLGGGMLEFHDVRVSYGASRFRAEVIDAGTVLEGRFATAGDRWLALVVVSDRQRP
jgi:4'-phosphopantetheinyl transferase EntD